MWGLIREAYYHEQTANIVGKCRISYATLSAMRPLLIPHCEGLWLPGNTIATNEKRWWALGDQSERSMSHKWQMREDNGLRATNVRGRWSTSDQWERPIGYAWPMREAYDLRVANEREAGEVQTCWNWRVWVRAIARCQSHRGRSRFVLDRAQLKMNYVSGRLKGACLSRNREQAGCTKWCSGE